MSTDRFVEMSCSCGATVKVSDHKDTFMELWLYKHEGCIEQSSDAVAPSNMALKVADAIEKSILARSESATVDGRDEPLDRVDIYVAPEGEVKLRWYYHDWEHHTGQMIEDEIKL